MLTIHNRDQPEILGKLLREHTHKPCLKISLGLLYCLYLEKYHNLGIFVVKKFHKILYHIILYSASVFLHTRQMLTALLGEPELKWKHFTICSVQISTLKMTESHYMVELTITATS